MIGLSQIGLAGVDDLVVFAPTSTALYPASVSGTLLPCVVTEADSATSNYSEADTLSGAYSEEASLCGD